MILPGNLNASQDELLAGSSYVELLAPSSAKNYIVRHIRALSLEVEKPDVVQGACRSSSARAKLTLNLRKYIADNSSLRFAGCGYSFAAAARGCVWIEQASKLRHFHADGPCFFLAGEGHVVTASFPFRRAALVAVSSS
jgi:hypothetical protein